MSFLDDLFGNDAYSEYADEMRQRAGAYNPWIQGGKDAFNAFGKYSTGMLENPTAEQNKLAQGFYDSPYQQQQLNQVKSMMNANAANTGMLDSQSANLNLGNQLTGMQGRFQQQYVDRGLQQFNNALRNKYLQSQMGLGALGQQSKMYQEGGLGDVMGAKAQSKGIGDLMGLIGSLGMTAALA